MKLKEITGLVEENYAAKVDDIEKIKSAYKIKCGSDSFCLKIVKYDLGHFLFILSAMKHLQHNGFESIPEIMKTTGGGDYIMMGNEHAYLTKWMNARECNYDNPIDVMVAASKLAELHQKSKGFKVEPFMNPRVGWMRWVDIFKVRKNEILDFKLKVEAKDVKTEFDSLYLEAMEKELDRCDRAVARVLSTDYYARMMMEISEQGFCHHDYAHHNVLLEKSGKVHVIDFDYCMLDTHLHDLSSLLIRRMKNGKWDVNNAIFVLDAYDVVYPVENEEIPVMCGFMEFPQDYWQVGIQYYWEKQPWGEEFFLKKLEKILEDREEKQEFIDEFTGRKYKG